MVKFIAGLWLFLYTNLAIAEDFIRLNFNAENVTSASLLTKAINLSLDEINARVAWTSEYSNEPFVYTLDLWHDKSLDLNKIYQIFIRHGIKVKRANKEQKSIDFLLDAQDLKIYSHAIDFDKELILERKDTHHFINLEGVSSILIKTTINSDWIPLIRLYNKELTQVKKIQNTKPTNQINLKLDNNTIYALIGDSVDMNNIKGGLAIKFSKE